MKTIEYGVSDASNVYIITASRFAKEALYYLLHIGQYYCTQGYMVTRKTYISFLLILVIKGKGYVVVDDRQSALHEGEIALIDCTKPHTFGTNDKWEILWIHFDGAQTRKIFNEIHNGIGDIILPHNLLAVTHTIEQIYNIFHHAEKTSEALISKYIYSILTELILSVPIYKNQKNHDNPIDLDRLLNYIQENITQDITVEMLAKNAAFSPYHFIRVFKNSTGFTPHEYIISLRISLAKQMLRSTNQPIYDIAAHCGFENNSSFSTSFRRIVGTTPRLYRKNER
jgi:AraC-like DNA-binding protein